MSFSVAGFCLGLSISISLRRYIPNLFGTFSPRTMIFDVLFAGGGYVSLNKYGTNFIYDFSHEFRKILLEENND